MDEPRKPKFTIVDKRGNYEEEGGESTSAAPPPQAQAPPPPPPPPPAPEPPPPAPATSQQESLTGPDMEPPPAGYMESGNPNDLRTTDFLFMMADELSVRAYIHLGLVENPSTGLMSKNQREAKLAIDTLQDVFRHLGPYLSPTQNMQVKDRMNQLRLAFVGLTPPRL